MIHFNDRCSKKRDQLSKPLLVFLAGSMLVWSVQSQASDLNEEIRFLESQVINSRLAIKSFEIIFDIIEKTERESSNYKVVRRHYFVDRDKMRIDTTYRLRVELPEHVTVPPEYTDITVWGDEHCYRFSNNPIYDEGQVFDMVMEVSQRVGDDDGLYFDCRILGLTASGMETNPPLNVFLGNSVRKDFSLSEESINGVPCKKISAIFPNGAQWATWVAPSQGYSVLKMECGRKDSQDIARWELIDCTELHVGEYENSGMWFPTHSFYRRFENNEWKTCEVLSVKVASLNKPLPSELFTPKGIGVPVGKKVFVTGEQTVRPLYWDGTQIVGESSSVLPPLPSRGNGTRYLLAAMGLALICAGCLMKYFELSKKQKEKQQDKSGD